jgi:C1A family cysteine protease
MSLIFKSKYQKNKYSITILGKNLPNTSHENSNLDIDLSNKDSKDEFIKEIISKIGSSNPTFITYKTLNEYKFTNNKIPNNHLPNTPK